MAEPEQPRERLLTQREALREALIAGEARTARELSAALSMQEREVLQHLEHLERTLLHSAQRLSVEPARCLACGFAFTGRARFSKPGRCPRCKATRITYPRFRIEWD